MSLSYHFRCEQWNYFAGRSFCQFNGTGGVWARAAMDDVGGWSTETLTEDMCLRCGSRPAAPR